MESDQYDERNLMTDYVWDYCEEAFSDFERDIRFVDKHKAIQNREQFLRLCMAGFWPSHTVEEVTRIADVVFGDLWAFKESVRDRVLREHPSVFKRCPHCGRLLRTPKAKQCRWCFRGWHELDGDGSKK